jgi:hypothetical protein
VVNDELPVEWVPLASLHPHPRNYRSHPEDQIEHLAASIEQHGYFRPVVIARDGTILAGHGVVQASGHLGVERVPAVRLNLDPESPPALKILTLDNELPRFAEVDDRALSFLLRDIAQQDVTGLVGTGYDDAKLAALLLVTRPVSEIEDFDEAASWLGLPDFAGGMERWQVIITCRSEADRARFLDEYGLGELISKTTGRVASILWPLRTEKASDITEKWEPVEP